MTINDVVQCAGKPGLWTVMRAGALPGMWWLESRHPTTVESLQVHENRLVAASTPVMTTQAPGSARPPDAAGSSDAAPTP